MAFRTKHSYSTPGGGTVHRSKSGKAKSYEGPGPAPAGTTKVPEKDYTEAPTVTVHSDGTVTATGFNSKKAAAKAKAAQGRAILRRAERQEKRKIRVLLSDLPEPISPEKEYFEAKHFGKAPSAELRKEYPHAYGKALKAFGEYHAEHEGLKEDPVAEFAIDTAATAGIGGAASLAGKALGTAGKGAAGELLAGGGSRLASTEATVAESAAEKGAKAAGKKIVAKVKTAPKKIKAAPRTARKAVATPAGRRAVVRKEVGRVGSAGKRAARHPVRSTGAGNAVAPVLGVDTPASKRANALAEGTAKAVVNEPLKTAVTTGRAGLGIITGPLALGESGLVSALHGDTDPFTEEASKQFEGTVGMGKKLLSGDPETVQKTVEDEAGLAFTPLIPKIITAGRESNLYEGARGRARARVKAGRDRGLATKQQQLADYRAGDRSKPPGKIRHPVIDSATGEQYVLSRAGKAIEGHRQRKQVSRATSREKARGQAEAAKASKEVVREIRHSANTGGVFRKRNLHHHNAGDILATVAQYGISRNRDRAMRQLEEVERSIAQGRADAIPAGTITDLDNINWIRKHPAIFTDKHFWKAVDAYKKQAKAIERSDRKKMLAVGDVYGLARPEERLEAGITLKDGRTVRAHFYKEPETIRRKQAELAQLRQEAKGGGSGVRRPVPSSKITGNLRIFEVGDRYELQVNRGESNRSPGWNTVAYFKTKEGAEGFTRIPLHEARAYLAEHGAPDPSVSSPEKAAQAKKLARELRDYREGLKQATKDYTREAQATIREKGLEQPAYVKDVRPRVGLNAEPAFPGGRSAIKQHMAQGSARARGEVDRSFETLAQQSIAEPRMREALHRSTTAFVERWAQPVKGRRYLTSDEISRAINRGELDTNQYAVLDAQFFKQAIRDPHKSGDEYLDAIRGASNRSIREEINARAADPGKKYVVVPREAVREFVHQMEPPKGLDRIFGKMNRLFSRAMLGYSPSWAVAQLVAEGVPAALSIGLNPLRWARVVNYMAKEGKRLSDHDRSAIDALAGESPGVTPHPQTEFRPETNALASDFFRLATRNPVGRALLSVGKGDALGYLDRWKGGKYRKAVAAAQADRQLNGFVTNLGELLRGQRSIVEAIKGKPLEDQMAYLAKHPDEAAKLEGYLDDVMGNWRALSSHEAKVAPLVVFYPYLRMSLRWAFWSFPKRHPVRAQILYFLSQQNAGELEKLIGGKPTLPFLYAFPVYTASNGEDAVMPGGARMSPGLSFLTEAAGKGDVGQLASGLNPGIAAVANAVYGKNPFTGDEAKTPTEHGLMLLNSLLSTWAPARALGLNRLGQAGESPASEYFAQHDPSHDLRTYLNPGLPQSGARFAEAQRHSRDLTTAHTDPVPGLPAEFYEVAQAHDWKKGAELRRQHLKAERAGDRASEAEAPLYDHPGGLDKEASELLAYMTGHYVIPAEDVKPPRNGKGEGIGGVRVRVGGGPVGGGGGGKIGGRSLSGGSGGIGGHPLGNVGKKGIGGVPLGSVGGKIGGKELGAGPTASFKGGKVQVTVPSEKKGKGQTVKLPSIEGFDNPDQKEFAEWFSHYSKLPPKLAGEWTKQEGGGWGSTGVSGGQAGEQNWLGVGYPGRNTPMSESHYFNGVTPKQAAKNTALWIEGKIGHEFGYRAAPSIQRISQLAKGGASESQLRAYIEGPSEWGTGAINTGGTISVNGARQAVDAGPPPKKVVKRFKAIKTLAAEIAKQHIPYVYGGGHNGGMPDPSEGLDCSSSTVYLFRRAGVKVPNITSGQFGNYFPTGPGAVTIFYNPTHVFLRIGNEYWGTSAGDNGHGGLGPHPAPSKAYLAQYSVAHVPGLGKKQALELGFHDLAGGSEGAPSFPGITFSNGGTTATITEGEGTKVGKPGFSSKPIQLTPLQRYNRKQRLFNSLDLTSSKDSSSPVTVKIPTGPVV